jgi:acrylyl-CoA reductase (NADPH)
MIQTPFQAFVVHVTDTGIVRQIETRAVDDLPPGDLLIRVRYSSLNYKDALSANGNRGVTRHYPHTPGIDAVGEVVESAHPAFRPGDRVIAGGYDLGMNTPGGYGQYIRIPAGWALPLPPDTDPLHAIVLGTAGFTAALCLQRLEDAGLRAADGGEILITGATGGVGSLAVMLLAQQGYHVVAATGKPEQADLLRALGAATVIDRRTLEEHAEKALHKQRWAAVIDTVGGAILANALKATRAYGWVAACGNAASPELSLTVYPFILRGVSLIGVDAANCSLELRQKIWGKLSGPWQLHDLSRLTTVIGLADLSAAIDATLAGQQVGRVVVDLWDRPQWD